MFRDMLRYNENKEHPEKDPKRYPNFVHESARSTFRAPLRRTSPDILLTCSWSDFFIEEADVW